MFIKRLKQQKKKSNSALFKRQVVEYYRADILSARQLSKELHISTTLLRCWNRWYFKIRLLRHFKSRLSFPMKNKDQEIEKLKDQLTQAYKENAQLKLKNEALQVMIHLAEDKFNIAIEKSPYQTITEMSKRHPVVEMQTLCDLFGKSRQSWYEAIWREEDQYLQEGLVVQEVLRIRKDLPRIGTEKLYFMLTDFLTAHQIKLGRDKLRQVLRDHNLIIKRKKTRVVTTFSKHGWYTYPNLIKDLKVIRANQLWVCDLTYIHLSNGFHYLSLITDAYSRKIVGWSLQKSMHTKEYAYKRTHRSFRNGLKGTKGKRIHTHSSLQQSELMIKKLKDFRVPSQLLIKKGGEHGW